MRRRRPLWELAVGALVVAALTLAAIRCTEPDTSAQAGRAALGHTPVPYVQVSPPARLVPRARLTKAVARRHELERRLAWHGRRVRELRRELAELPRLRAQVRALTTAVRRPRSPQGTVCGVFGPYCWQALQIVACETGDTWSTTATNGQYEGLFQMGSAERATYGDSSSAWGQALAALRYFLASGADWSPWACRSAIG